MHELAELLKQHLAIAGSDKIIAEETHDLDRANFKDIKGKETMVGFVDGGNLDLIDAGPLSVFFNRIYSSVFDPQKVGQNMHEFYSLISHKDNQFDIKILPVTGKIELGSIAFRDDHRLFTFEKKASILGNVVRRLAELKIASQMKIPVVIDGSRECKLDEEKLLMADNIFGLSKTTDMMTKNGRSAAAAVSQIAPQGIWEYKLGKTSFVKFHPGSRYVFRFDAAGDAEDVLFTLMRQSKDPAFLGYPYGLLNADKMAQVTRREAAELAFRLRLLVGEDLLEPHINSNSSHSILDSL